jgi:protein-S-isoprenylcysteine O-methyltransferase Ste14
LVVWFVVALVLGTSAIGRTSARGRAVRLLLVAAVWIAAGYGYRLPSLSNNQTLLYLGALGAAVCVVGLSFAIWARISLGRSWGMPMTLHEQPELVTAGPYRLVRHPIYTGMLLMFAGTSLVFPLAAVPSAIFVAYFVFSARREERDMGRKFPDTYAAYKQRSKMLIPFVF